MKILIILAIALPLVSMSQTSSHYYEVMEKFKKFYNAGQVDSINALYGHGWDSAKLRRPIWTNARAAEYLEKYGQLKSFKFVCIDKKDPDQIHIFQTVFSKKGSKLTGLTLDEDNKLSTFRFSTGITEIPGS
jgi:hypothetical protein